MWYIVPRWRPSTSDLLDPDDPFEVNTQLGHLFKHGPFGLEDIYDVWWGDPVFYPAKPPADWLMVGEVPGDVLVVPLMKPSGSGPGQVRPIGVYRCPEDLRKLYRLDRRSDMTKGDEHGRR